MNRRRAAGPMPMPPHRGRRAEPFAGDGGPPLAAILAGPPREETPTMPPAAPDVPSNALLLLAAGLVVVGALLCVRAAWSAIADRAEGGDGAASNE